MVKGWLIAALAVVLVGCTATVDGRSSIEPLPAGSDGANPALMQTGDFPTKPAPVPAPGARGGYVEAHRMAEYVIGPWEADPSLQRLLAMNTMTIGHAGQLALTFAGAAVDIARKHGFVNGFTTGRKTPTGQPDTSLLNVVMRFPDPGAATAAATEMAADQPEDLPVGTPLPIPGHPEAIGSSSKSYDGDTVVESFTPHGPYILYQYARSSDSVGAATDLVVKILDRQVPRIDAFAPIPPADFATAVEDSSGLLERTLPSASPTDGNRPSPNAGIYGPYAALHFSASPSDATDDGIEAMVLGPADVVQYKDRGGAAGALDESVAALKSLAKPGRPVPGLPAAKCFDHGDDAGSGRFECVVVADRYLMSTASEQDAAAKQALSAQYLMLTA